MEQRAQRRGGRPAGSTVSSDGLSDRQRQILRFVTHHIETIGYPPSMREIGEAVDLSSTSSVSHQVHALESKGYLRRDPKRPRVYVPAVPTPAQHAANVSARPTSVHVRPRKLTLPQYQATPRNGSGPDAHVGVVVPVIGRIAAGTPTSAEQHIEEMMTLPRMLVGSGELFVLSVAGDSMTGAGILDGDFVTVRRQPSAEHGDIVAALLGSEATVKRLRRDGANVWLAPENDHHTPIWGNEADILGKVVAVMRRL
ncbi:transcriptional repressor LexA [Streptomyces sp. NPDC047525]|uniref:transcriptional repressor LexA n=1 Tax=Streptomyces sp. NPDC047525 TaxID=3155264 RepID=UPI0033C7EDD4